MPFHLNSKQLFLTYPQCNLIKEDAYDFLLNKFNPEMLCVAHELHANGDNHLHVYMKLNQPVETRDQHFADLEVIDSKWHGNYQGCRSSKNVLKYCTKKEDYIANFDVGVKTESAAIRKLVSAKIVNEGIPLTQLVKDFPELIFGYKKLKGDIEEYKRDVDDARADLPRFIPNPWGFILDTQIQAKKRHYWIYSLEPNKGKTTKIAKPLEQNHRVYVKTGDYTYWSFKGDEQAIILDEYNTGALKWSFMNSMCDGTAEYRVFLGGCKKLKDPLIIILSNNNIQTLYPNMAKFLHERFIQLEVK